MEDEQRAGITEQPTDDKILEQYRAIKSEEADRMPFVGDKESISSLVEEYENGSQIIKEKIEKLSHSFDAIRRTRGDGNCFFRAFLFSFLENFLETQSEKDAFQILSCIENVKRSLTSLGYSELSWEDFVQSFVELVETCRAGQLDRLSSDDLLEKCRDPEVSNYAVMFLRLATSAEIQTKADFYEPFVLGASGMDCLKFCRSCVEPMGEESDHIHITAISSALHVKIRVVYLDRSGDGESEANVHEFSPSDSKVGSGQVLSTITLLYRPGHYDIVYPKRDEAKTS